MNQLMGYGWLIKWEGERNKRIEVGKRGEIELENIK